MGSLSNAYENKLLDLLFGAVDPSLPASFYVGVWTTVLDDTSDGDSSGEPATGAYARVAVTRNQTNFPAAVAGAIANGTVVTFPQATASWGTIISMALLDASTSGDIIVYGALPDPEIVNNGDTLTVDIGEMVATIN